MNNSFDINNKLTVNEEQFHIHSLRGIGDQRQNDLPSFFLKILLEKSTSQMRWL